MRDMADYTPEDREAFEAEAVGLYEEAVESEGLRADDPRLVAGGSLHRAFTLLIDMGLMQQDLDSSAWHPIEPSAAQSRIVTPLGQEGARLLEESARWAEAFGGISQTWRRSPQAASSGPITYLQGGAISPFLTGLLAEAQDELLTAQPQADRDAQSLAAATLRDIEALDRGLAMRTIYQHSARRQSITREYVAQVTARGAEVRTLDEFFNRMIIVDRRVAIIPGREGLHTAVVVRDPSVVAYLVDVFERTFARARPFADTESSALKEIAAEQRAMTIRMLVEGHSDGSSAKRLGVSPRTYAGYVADLKEEYDAETRFQLGYAMGQQGVTGQETSDVIRSEGDRPRNA